MRDDICTIPISEVFEKQDGCPLCRMYRTVEERILDYILGDAMMEPDVRLETNRLGFCGDHFEKMYRRRGRLQLALMLETHIKEVEKGIFAKKLFSNDWKKGKKAYDVIDSCFVCEKVEWGTSRMLDTVYRCYENEREFRELFNGQPMFCLSHYQQLMAGIEKRKMPRYGGEMAKHLTEITGEYAKSLSQDISKYCSMYDYRNNVEGADWGNSKDAVERTIAFLSEKDFTR
ncbi:MAG: hypothetical protein IKI29_05735 [Clostridia bacterium]|nr:hypothetical protein [Clostridia bacterium]